MAKTKHYYARTNEYSCELEVSPDYKSKLIISKDFKVVCNLEFKTVFELMDLADELVSLGQQWIAEEEYDAGYRKFYME